MDKNLRRRDFLSQYLKFSGTALGITSAPQISYGLGTTRLRKPIVRGGAWEAVQSLGLTTNLKICLDPKNSTSYSGGQTWSDLSGNSGDFYRGATSGAEGSDPTYDSNGYFTSDGGDFFTYTAGGRPAWMNNVHKDNARFTIAMWLYVTSAGAGSSLGFIGNSNSVNGFFLGQASGNNVLFIVFHGSGQAKSLTGPVNVPHNQWALFSVSLDEAVGASGASVGVNDQFLNNNSTYTSPSAVNGTETLAIGKRHSAYGTNLSSGSRYGMVFFWEGSRLTNTNITNLYNATKGTYGL